MSGVPILLANAIGKLVDRQNSSGPSKALQRPWFRNYRKTAQFYKVTAAKLISDAKPNLEKVGRRQHQVEVVEEKFAACLCSYIVHALMRDQGIVDIQKRLLKVKRRTTAAGTEKTSALHSGSNLK